MTGAVIDVKSISRISVRQVERVFDGGPFCGTGVDSRVLESTAALPEAA
jgi:hypothetical protein